MVGQNYDWLRRGVCYSRDGSGNYSLPQAAFVPGTTIESAKLNSDFSDIAAALTQSLSKDGQTTATASLPMGGFKLTGLGAGSGTGESVRYDEFKPSFRSHLAGLTISRASATMIGVAAGAWTESGQTLVFANSSSTIDCATTGAGGLDAGSLANNTWYHVFAIGKTDLTTSALASTSASSPTMPSGYTLKRRIGSFRTNGSAQVIAFVQQGDVFTWDVPVSDWATTNPGTSAVTRTLTVPTGVVVFAWFSNTESNTTNNRNVLWTALDQTDTAPTNSLYSMRINCAAAYAVSSEFYVKTNTSAQIRYRTDASGAADVTSGSTHGWVDRRGRDD